MNTKTRAHIASIVERYFAAYAEDYENITDKVVPFEEYAKDFKERGESDMIHKIAPCVERAARILFEFEDPVKVTCYGKTQTWERKDALEFYLDAMASCEGAERDRYVNIYYQLARGAKEARDC